MNDVWVRVYVYLGCRRAGVAAVPRFLLQTLTIPVFLFALTVQVFSSRDNKRPCQHS